MVERQPPGVLVKKGVLRNLAKFTPGPESLLCMTVYNTRFQFI